jgi:hypothetical protein
VLGVGPTVLPIDSLNGAHPSRLIHVQVFVRFGSARAQGHEEEPAELILEKLEEIDNRPRPPSGAPFLFLLGRVLGPVRTVEDGLSGRVKLDVIGTANLVNHTQFCVEYEVLASAIPKADDMRRNHPVRPRDTMFSLSYTEPTPCSLVTQRHGATT